MKPLRLPASGLSPAPVLALLAMVLPVSAQTDQASAPDAAVDPMAATAPAGAIPRNRIISILPDDKRALLLKPDERNPFARRNPDVDLITEASNQETEADLIRDILNALPITGRSYGPKGLRVLAGEIIFERGKLVDQVIENQSENLIVESVNDATIELAWIDLETGKLTGKRLILPYDLSPKVRFVLKGQPRGDDESAPVKFGLLRPNGIKPPTADQIAVEKRPNGISADIFNEGQ